MSRSPVEQDECREDGYDAEGGDGGDGEDDGKVDNDHHCPDHKTNDGEHVDNQPGDEIVSVGVSFVELEKLPKFKCLQFFIDPQMRRRLQPTRMMKPMMAPVM